MLAAVCFALGGCAIGARADELPQGFVYLRDVAPSIAQDMRYAGPDNFTGKPVPGYGAAECVLQAAAAKALARAQVEAQRLGLSLKVYDCYRPVRAVRAFVAWAGAPEDGRSAIIPGSGNRGSCRSTLRPNRNTRPDSRSI